MRSEKYIYIIKRDGTIYEVQGESKGRTVKSVTDALNNRTLVYFEDIDGSINGADVSDVCGLEMYLNHINTKRPKMYVRKGKIRKLARDEKVKPQLQEKLRLQRLGIVDCKQLPKGNKQLMEARKELSESKSIN